MYLVVSSVLKEKLKSKDNQVKIRPITDLKIMLESAFIYFSLHQPLKCEHFLVSFSKLNFFHLHLVDKTRHLRMLSLTFFTVL